MVDPGFVPGLIGWGVGKTLDQVIKYVAEARNCFAHCEELQTLLLHIKPIVERAIQHSNGASISTSDLPGGAAAWLRDLSPQLEAAEEQLEKALNWLGERKKLSGVPFDIITKNKWSQSIRKITEGIRKVAHDRAPFVNLESTLHTSRAVQELTILVHKTLNADRRQVYEARMEVAELRLTKLVHTELCKIEGQEAVVNEVKDVIEAAIKSEMQEIKRWQQTCTPDEPEVDGSNTFTARFERILSGLTNDQQASSQVESGTQAASQEEYGVAGPAMEDLSTREAYMPALIRYSLDTLKDATNNFAIKNEVGRGGSATVFRGVLTNGEIMAVKKFSEQNGLKKFLNEMEMQGLCGHQNIMRLHGYHTKEKPCKVRKLRNLFKTRQAEESVHALVFEYMENGALSSFLHGGNCVLDWNTRFDIVLGISRGLVYLHHDGPRTLVHCDIKPSNILLDAHLRAKIADFGIAQIFNSGLTQITSVKGTLGYIDPEYVMTGDVSLMVDVYSFGVTLLEIFSGKHAFDLDSLQIDEEVLLVGRSKSLFEMGGVQKVVEELLDPKLMNETYPTSQVFLVVHVALLCVNYRSIHRPTMQEVLSMLLGEMALKPIHKEENVFTPIFLP